MRDPGCGVATGIHSEHYPWVARCVSGYRLVEDRSAPAIGTWS